MPEETETEKRRTLLRNMYLWTALHVLLAAVVVRWIVDVPQLITWMREYWVFLLIVSIGCGSACLWLKRYLSWVAMYSCALLFVISTAMLNGLCGKEIVENIISPGLLSAAVLYGLLACYGYVTSKEMEGALFNWIWLFIPSALLATYVTFFREAIVWVPIFVLLGLTFCVPYPRRLKCYGCEDNDYNDSKEALRGCVACLAFPLFLVMRLCYLILVLIWNTLCVVGLFFGGSSGKD